PPDDNRLDDPVGANRLRELLEPRIVDVQARLKVVRREAIDVGFRRGARGRLRQIGDERAETFAEGETLFHSVHHCCGSPEDTASWAHQAAERSRTSRARARYASAPRDFTS